MSTISTNLVINLHQEKSANSIYQSANFPVIFSYCQDGRINYQEFVAMMRNNSPEIVPNRRRMF
jgi:hypothetical protein